jgi:hypothetical protein
LGEDADLVAHCAPAGGGILYIDSMRLQDDEIDPCLHGIAHDLRGTVPEGDLFSQRHCMFSKRMPEAREVVACLLFKAVIEIVLLPRSHLGDDLHHV